MLRLARRSPSVQKPGNLRVDNQDSRVQKKTDCVRGLPDSHIHMVGPNSDEGWCCGLTLPGPIARGWMTTLTVRGSLGTMSVNGWTGGPRSASTLRTFGTGESVGSNEPIKHRSRNRRDVCRAATGLVRHDSSGKTSLRPPTAAGAARCGNPGTETGRATWSIRGCAACLRGQHRHDDPNLGRSDVSTHRGISGRPPAGVARPRPHRGSGPVCRLWLVGDTYFDLQSLLYPFLPQAQGRPPPSHQRSLCAGQAPSIHHGSGGQPGSVSSHRHMVPASGTTRLAGAAGTSGGGGGVSDEHRPGSIRAVCRLHREVLAAAWASPERLRGKQTAPADRRSQP